MKLTSGLLVLAMVLSAAVPCMAKSVDAGKTIKGKIVISFNEGYCGKGKGNGRNVTVSNLEVALNRITPASGGTGKPKLFTPGEDSNSIG